jgi:hypothetical protein
MFISANNALAAAPVGNVDATGLANFTYSNSTGTFGVGLGGRTLGILTLPTRTSSVSSITALQFLVGDSVPLVGSTGNSGGTSVISVGSGNASLDLSGNFDYTQTYTIFQNTTSTPADFQFAAVTGYDAADYTPVFTSSGGNYLLSFTPAVVPEPASLALLALAAPALLRRRR